MAIVERLIAICLTTLPALPTELGLVAICPPPR